MSFQFGIILRIRITSNDIDIQLSKERSKIGTSLGVVRDMNMIDETRVSVFVVVLHNKQVY